MKSDYSVIHPSANVGSVINRLHREELLCVIIQDRSDFDTLCSCIDWYRANMNFSIHVAMFNDREKIEKLRERYFDLSYIVFNSPVSLGAQINAMATECYSTYFLLVRSDMRLIRFDGGQLMDCLQSKPLICTVTPVLRSRNDEILPSIRIPSDGVKGTVSTKAVAPDGGMDSKKWYNTLYPLYGLGLYRRALFQRMRGMDEQVESVYWQTLDFGTRSWLFGFCVVSTDCLQMQFSENITCLEDISEEKGSDRVIAKVLGVVQRGGRNVVSASLTNARLVRDEVKPRLSLYKTDYSGLCAVFSEKM